MDNPPNRRALALKGALCLSLLCTVAIVVWILSGPYQAVFHSDGAIKSVLAQLAWQEGRPIPAAWVYANGDLMFAGPQALTLLLYPWMGAGYQANALADWIVYLLLLAVCAWTCRSLDRNRNDAALAAAACAAGGLSYLNFEFVIGQGTYAGLTAIALTLFVLAARSDATRMRSRPILATAAVLAGIACTSNPRRAWITILLPIFAGWAASRYLCASGSWRERIRSFPGGTIAAIAIGAATGTIFYRWMLQPSMLNIDAAARLQLAAPSALAEHMLKLPGAWFGYFRIAGDWSSLGWGMRLLQSLLWLLSVSLILAPLRVAASPSRYDRRLHAFACILVANYACSFSALVVMAGLFNDATEIRYATFAIYGSLCLTALMIAQYACDRPALTRGLLLAFGASGLAFALAWRASNPITMPRHGATLAERRALIESLAARKVGAAVGSYWQSHVTTILSEGRLVVYPVVFDTQISPFPHHAPRTEIGLRESSLQAVVLTRDELASGKGRSVEEDLGAPHEKIDIGPFQAWIYDRNIVREAMTFDYEYDRPLPEDGLGILLSRDSVEACTAASCENVLWAKNTGRITLASAGTRPLRLGFQGLDANGRVIAHDLGRADFPHPLLPGTSSRVSLALPAVPDARIRAYRICLVQETVAWLCQRTATSVQAERTAPKLIDSAQ